MPPSPPLVMQRHRILSRDGEAARRVLVPQIDFTLLSPSGRYESFPDSALSRPTTHSDGVRIEGRSASVWAKKSARTLEIPDSGQGVPKQPSNLRNGRGKPGFEAPGASFFRAREGVGSLGFGPSFAASVFAQPKLSDNTDATTERIRKTNLSLQTISINSNMRYFAPNARPCSFESGRYALPTARFARQTLAVEWKTSTCA